MAIPVYDDDGVFAFDLPDDYQGARIVIPLRPPALPPVTHVLTWDDLQRADAWMSKTLTIPILTVYQARADGLWKSRIGCVPDLVSALDPEEVHARSKPTRWQPTAAQLAEVGGNPWLALAKYAADSGLEPTPPIAHAWRLRAAVFEGQRLTGRLN